MSQFDNKEIGGGIVKEMKRSKKAMSTMKDTLKELNPQLECFDFDVPDTIDTIIRKTTLKAHLKKQKTKMERQNSNAKVDTFNSESELLRKLKQPTLDDYRKTHSFLSIQPNKQGFIDQVVPNDILIPNDKIFANESFNPGYFGSFDFENRLQQCVYSSLSDKPDRLDRYYTLPIDNTLLKSKSSYDDHSDTFSVVTDPVSDIKMIELCLSDRIDLYARKNKKRSHPKPGSSVIKEDDNKELFSTLKVQAAPEYKSLLMFYQQITSLSERNEVSYMPFRDEELDKELMEYFKELIMDETSKHLKNKLKIVMKLINNVDKVTQMPVYQNAVKNQMLRYWKTEYEREVEEETLKKKEEFMKQIKDEEEMKKARLQTVKSVANKDKERSVTPIPLNNAKGRVSSRFQTKASQALKGKRNQSAK